ncbi:nucleotidyltransferase domain-containing protein [uncultured Desulfuromusa sp.]|uniref:type VII toxin-antitoxin system MntA family adenylyltransferase antitoxin n=1 Tax=uncultured Desulfuromusa sp. TaxID=219183 RepID=UPI002AA67D96|nr:nucleotidyltransferase domain-containing protein [uncultured Desulfuromusa sp.]
MNTIVKKNNQEQIETITSHLSAVLMGRSGVAAVYLLGSAAKGMLRKDSDIDIAFLPITGQDISLQVRLELASILENRLHRKIDIGVITGKNLIYASEAILNGLRIVTLQKNYTETMETRLLGCYYTFRQDRREVEESYGSP